MVRRPIALMMVLVACSGSSSTGRDSPPPAPLTASTSTASARFTEAAVTVGAGPLALPGVLTLPGPGLHPGVVILGGSGPTDRDGTAGPAKPLREIAHGLAPHGVAALRFDKRPKAQPAELLTRPNPTLRDEYIDDALVALEMLRRRPEVDPSRVFLLGHSLGATVAPRVAVEAPWVAGLVLMAAGLETPGDANVRQTEYLARLDAMVSPGEQIQIDAARRGAEAMRTLATGGEIIGPPP